MESTEKKAKTAPDRLALVSRLMINYAIANIDDVNSAFSEGENIPDGCIKVDGLVIPEITEDEAKDTLELHTKLHKYVTKKVVQYNESAANEPHTITVKINEQETEVDGTSRADAIANLKKKILEIKHHPGLEVVIITRAFKETATFTQGGNIDFSHDPEMAATMDKMAWYIEYMDNGTGELDKCDNFDEGLSELMRYAEGPGDHWA